MSRFKSRPHPPPQDILTPGPDLPWELVGPGESYLLVELEKLYWAGVERELKNIIQTLRVWRRPEYSYISIPDETDDFIYGFDTFIDQVCQESREFALRYGKRRRREDADKPSAILGQDHKSEYALKQAFLDNKAERNSMRIRGEVRAEIENLPQLEGLELRAAMLLQSAGFLDIDKITEYRPPRDKSRPRPGIPQLTLTINEHSQPEFHPLHCSACNAIIYDSMFARQPFVPKPYTICSDCYWAQHYSDPAFVKVHKHSVLHAIDTSTSGRLCKCESVPHFDSSGRSRSLFPLNPNDRHITSGKDRCPLLDLAGMVSHAKYRGLLSSIGMKPQGSESGSVGRMIERVKSIKLGKADRKNNASQVGTGHLRDMDHTAGPPAEDDIPAFFRHRTENNPFGDEHMALRVGPLVIENGVESTKSGALITLRNPPVFHERFEHAASQPALMVDGTPERLLWQQSNRLVSQPKRYKTMMKQVVGVPFSGLVRSKQDQELEILKLVVEASQSATASSESDLQQDLDSRISRILDQLQDLLLPRVRVYLSSIASQLLNPSTTLTWNPTSNTCHSFCTSLLDPTLFTPLVNGPPKNPDTNTNPLYLISFYTPPPQPNQHPLTQTPTPIPRTKHDIPPGHIQEFLIQPSTSPSSDLIDSLTHYSTDWSSFSRPLYPHQLLFPWDCTEGYARCPMPCGGCNLSKHVWAFPFDSWSLVSLHLGREKYLYPALQRGEYNHLPLRGLIHTQAHTQPPDPSPSPSPNPQKPNPTLEETHETRKEWIQNRLSILHASWILARTASGMARSATFQKSTTWIHAPSSSSSFSSFPPTETIKKGGIHRAQPNSHYFERGTNAHYFLSTWAGKPAHEQQSEYEALRGERMRMEDVLGKTRGRFYADSSSSSSRAGSNAKVQTRGWSSRGLKKKDKGSGDRSYQGFEGEDSTRFTGNSQVFYHSTYTPGSGSGGGGSECVDAQFGSIVGLASIGQHGGETGYDPAMDPGVNCASGCGSSSIPSGGESGSGGGGGGGWSDGGGGGYSGGGSSGGDGGGGSSGGDGGGGGGGGGDGGG